jgi:hypothetical protein
MTRETRYRVEKHATEITEHWTSGKDMAAYHYDMIRKDAEGMPGEVDLDGQPGTAGQYQVLGEQSTLVRAGKLTAHTKTAGIDLLPPTMSVSPEFVPGGWLATFLGKVSNQPMILQTESPIGLSAQGTSLHDG